MRGGLGAVGAAQHRVYDLRVGPLAVVKAWIAPMGVQLARVEDLAWYAVRNGVVRLDGGVIPGACLAGLPRIVAHQPTGVTQIRFKDHDTLLAQRAIGRG